MPELPEVECLKEAVAQFLTGATLKKAKFYRKDLRGPIPITEFSRRLVGYRIEKVLRRSKYMLWHTEAGVGVFHLGMTGNMILRDSSKPAIPHTHGVFQFEGPRHSGYLHFIDPRRFGWITCCGADQLAEHPFFAKLGPEPLDTADLDDHLWQLSRNRTVNIKNFVMNAHMVVGVGNIYANEALFKAGIRPTRRAGKVTRKEMTLLCQAIKKTLKNAIKAGGTTLRDFKDPQGEPGYFKHSLAVYGRAGQSCINCRDEIKLTKISGRATYSCSSCQK